MWSYSVEAFAASLGVVYDILVWGVGILAMAFSVFSFQFKHRVTIILGNFLGQSLWVVHFLLQGDLTSAIACALSAIMLAVFAKKEQWKWATHPLTVAAFIVLLSGFSLLCFAGWSDIFPLLAGIFAVLANCQSTEKRLRQLSFFWCFFWLLNSSFKMYPVDFANNLLCTASTVVSLIRYREKK